MLHALLALPLLLSSADTTRIRSATTISTGSGENLGVFLNLEIGPLPAGKAPVVDRAVFAGTTATVAWHLADNDTAGTARWANLIVPCPSKSCAVPDTVVDDAWKIALRSGGRAGYQLPRVCPMIKCQAFDSTAAFQYAVGRIRSASMVARIRQAPILTLVAVSPWKRTTGIENYPDVAVPMAGNEGNWISFDAVRYAVDSLVVGYRICLTGSESTLCEDLAWSIPFGPVQYEYQIASDPWQADTSRTGRSFVFDSILKMGPRIHLAGTLDHPCFREAVDSLILTQDSWLIAANGKSTDSVASAFTNDLICGPMRRGAWPYRSGSVEIVSGTWVTLKQLMDAARGDASIRDIPPESARPFLFRVGNQTRLRLAAPAQVRVVDLRGAELMPTSIFGAGTSILPVQPRVGMAFVQVRTGMSTVTLPLEPLR